ncbi:hypothetical protein Cantr_10409 [Candida viswanathii]|uniref:Uncharacterized protein n=1 Tax=Candida viswanathii TaxID=5486 RepID=A0A367YF90_9ASCO|nr:hypothetical protein Cantr_10409 [Candida viswanathii]
MSSDKQESKSHESKPRQWVGKVEHGSDKINEQLDNIENGFEKGVKKSYDDMVHTKLQTSEVVIKLSLSQWATNKWWINYVTNFEMKLV